MLAIECVQIFWEAITKFPHKNYQIWQKNYQIQHYPRKPQMQPDNLSLILDMLNLSRPKSAPYPLNYCAAA